MDVDTPSPPAEPEHGAGTLADDDDESDPIVSSYAVFTNPPPTSTHKILILQHPNKQGPTRGAFSTLSEVRVKPSSGMIEVDVPLSYHDGSYDRDKGMRWGQSLARSMNQKSGGSHGLAGGFGVGIPAPRGAGRARKEEDRDTYDWTEAVRRDQVLRTQTLGGQYVGRNSQFGDNECRWMVGVFKGGNLHLTPAQSEIQLRPQLHHLDATAEQDRLTRPRDGPGAGPGMGKDGAPTGPAPAPRAISMMIKSSGNGDAPATETMADRLRQVQVEHWQRLKYVEDDKDEAWELYQKTLIYRSPEFLLAAQEEAKGKGKGLDIKPDEDEKDQLQAKAPMLQTRWDEDDYLRGVAGKDKDGVLEGYGKTALPGIKPGDVVEEVKKEDADGKKTIASAKGKGKATAGPAATTSAAGVGTTATRRPSAAKGKAPAKGSAMQID